MVVSELGRKPGEHTHNRGSECRKTYDIGLLWCQPLCRPSLQALSPCLLPVYFLDNQRRPRTNHYEGADHNFLNALAPIDGTPATFCHRRQHVSIPPFDLPGVLPRLQTKHPHLRTTVTSHLRHPHPILKLFHC